jgi:hypothetical protein
VVSTTANNDIGSLKAHLETHQELHSRTTSIHALASHRFLAMEEDALADNTEFGCHLLDDERNWTSGSCWQYFKAF